MRASILLLLPVIGVLGTPLQALPQERGAPIEQRAVTTYAQTCSYFGIILGSTTSTNCNTPTTSGPYVSVNCLGAGGFISLCALGVTASTCFPVTTTQTVTLLGLTQTNLVPFTRCTTLTFPPAPAATTTRASSTSSKSTTKSPSVTSSSTTTSSSTKPTTSTRPGPIGTYKPLPTAAAGYSFIGCYLDSGSRTLPNAIPNVNSVEECISGCSGAGYTLAGVEYYGECYCGNELVGNGPTVIDSKNCNYACTGSPSETCGGGNAIQVYEGTPPPPQYLSSPFTNGVCVSDNVNSARTLNGAAFPAPNMTPLVCKASCNDFAYYGVEYSTECYCGNSIPSNIPYSSACTMACGGNSGQTCGGPNAMNIYSQ